MLFSLVFDGIAFVGNPKIVLVTSRQWYIETTICRFTFNSIC